MPIRTITFSDLTGEAITDPDDVVRVVVYGHPDAPDQRPVVFYAALDELAGIDKAATVGIALIFANDQRVQIAVKRDAFDKLATAQPMTEVLKDAKPATRQMPASRRRRDV